MCLWFQRIVWIIFNCALVVTFIAAYSGISSGISYRTLLMINQHWFRYMIGASRHQTITSRYMKPYGVLRPQWVKKSNREQTLWANNYNALLNHSGPTEVEDCSLPPPNMAATKNRRIRQGLVWCIITITHSHKCTHRLIWVGGTVCQKIVIYKALILSHGHFVFSAGGGGLNAVRWRTRYIWVLEVEDCNFRCTLR